ncbi:MAG: hypothetical protein AMXMBFR82_53590 [Candidatus Hydrogenedentota bacterium]
MQGLYRFPTFLRVVSAITLASFVPSAAGAAELLAALPDAPQERPILPLAWPGELTEAEKPRPPFRQAQSDPFALLDPLNLAEARIPSIPYPDAGLPKGAESPAATDVATGDELPAAEPVRLARTMTESLHSVDILENTGPSYPPSRRK